MSKIGKMWWAFAVIGNIATFLNPYIGIFGTINWVELLIMLGLDINLIIRVKSLRKYGENKLLKTLIKALGIVTYIISVIFFLFKTFVSVIIPLLAYTDGKLPAPFQIWSNQDKAGVVCFIVGTIFNVLLLISLICRGRDVRRIAK